jgi:hypothetical protein
MARSALLLLDSGFWILDSSVGHRVFNRVGAIANFFANSTLREPIALLGALYFIYILTGKEHTNENHRCTSGGHLPNRLQL